MVTIDYANTTLKSFYLDAVSEALNTKVNPLLARIQKSETDVWGKDVRKLVRYGIAGGVSAGEETGDLPVSGGNNCVQFVSTLKNLYGTVEISDKAIKASAKNDGAFVSILDDEMTSLVKSSRYNFGRMLYGDGTGKLASVSVSEEDAQKGVISVDSAAVLIEGMLVDFCTPTGAKISGYTAREITKIDRENKKITVSGDAIEEGDLPQNAYIVIQGSSKNELTGLAAIFSNSETLYGVNRAENLWMKPYIQENTGEFTIPKFQKAVDKIEERSGSKVDFAVCSFGVKRAIYNYFVNNCITPEIKEVDGGYKAIMVDGIPVVADRFCQDNTLYLLDSEDFRLHQLCDWQWLEDEQGCILKQIAGKAAFSATLVKYAELMCVRPNGQGVLRGVSEA